MKLLVIPLLTISLISLVVIYFVRDLETDNKFIDQVTIPLYSN